MGELYQTEFKKNIFSKYYYYKSIYNNKEYNSYNIGLGNKSVNCIYLDDTQIAQIEKESVVYNDLHHFEIYVSDTSYSLLSILITCYKYITSYFKPGVKVKKSVTKSFQKTTNKDLRAKYNPEWKEKMIK